MISDEFIEICPYCGYEIFNKEDAIIKCGRTSSFERKYYHKECGNQKDI